MSTELVIKVALADDHKIFRDGIKMALKGKEYLKILWEAEDGRDLMHKMQIKKPDVLLMDIRMPGMDGIAATGTIHEQYPNIQIIALTSGLRVEAEAAVAAGASGYIFKSVSVYEIVDMIRAIYAKQMASSDPSV